MVLAGTVQILDKSVGIFFFFFFANVLGNGINLTIIPSISCSENSRADCAHPRRSKH